MNPRTVLITLRPFRILQRQYVNTRPVSSLCCYPQKSSEISQLQFSQNFCKAVSFNLQISRNYAKGKDKKKEKGCKQNLCVLMGAFLKTYLFLR